MSSVHPTFSEDELQNEEWRPVVGLELLYEVSTLGRVRSIRNCTSSKVGHILKPKGRKYSRLILSNGPLRHTVLVHRLVVFAFLGEPPPAHEVNHKDGNKFNNRLVNLEYVTHPENHRHAVATGLHTYDSIQGERNVNAKLTDEKVRLIRQRLRDGVGVNAIGREVGMPYQRIQEIRDGIGWAHIT